LTDFDKNWYALTHSVDMLDMNNQYSSTFSYKTSKWLKKKGK